MCQERSVCYNARDVQTECRWRNESMSSKQESKPTTKVAKAPSTVAEVREASEIVLGMIDQFCREQLNAEYAELCRLLAEKLARKRPSPLLKGQPNTWACAILRTIGWANFLDDPAQEPHLKLTAIDKHFGVSQGTAASKSLLIRKMFRMSPFDPAWTLSSKLGDNPMVWMVQVNGFMADIRTLPREVQELAFEKGIIPYIPADQV